MFTKKFLGLVPLRSGNKVLAYVGIVTSVAILIYYSLVARDISLEFSKGILTGDYGLEYAPGEERLSKEDEKFAFTITYYYILGMVFCYYFVYMTFIIFSAFLAIGAHHDKRGLLNAYFIYGFVHCCFCLFLACLHYYIDEYVEVALIVASDVVFLFCLCGVKGLMNTVNSGHAGHVYAQYEDGKTIKA